MLTFYVLLGQPSENGALSFGKQPKLASETVPEHQPVKQTPIAHRKSKSTLFLGLGQNQLGNVIDHREKLAPLLGCRESYRLRFSR